MADKLVSRSTNTLMKLLISPSTSKDICLVVSVISYHLTLAYVCGERLHRNFWIYGIFMGKPQMAFHIKPNNCINA